MVYVILIFGLIIIYAALKMSNKGNSAPDFENVLKGKKQYTDVESVILQLKELENRVDELENAFLLYKSEFDSSVLNSVDLPSADNSEPEPMHDDTAAKVIKPKGKDRNSNYINDQIYALYDNGNSVEEIASILHMGKGEISLRLGLRKQKI